MDKGKEYYIVAKEAMPGTFLKVVEAKKLMQSGKHKTASAAFDAVGISRSTYYKYKDLISPFYERGKNSTITMALDLEDVPGYLNGVLSAVAREGANILTINQTIPINGIANITMTLETKETTFLERIRELEGVKSMKILARE